ncbi:deoxyribose-phosphate aldolase [Bacteroidales bacterium OttesenSCG-928-K03]|nr:deoxyribose-phosphate aldolase [Odoribacter sp. OttesenSCG-928-L07]MDL2239441.1 deoxyribose-phosphate aldolase [Bacteroidales bacterium OttesenSCG-928-L14]MDL2240562.1 deoxyribose-phosphate aldolase [Bacteroidales bacterium OttesenSCG-928-K22]MDL2242656.1 deoxyribose-phosphate aldolase [Bacteroidales bacterium OttesenSCG-928-K03]
MDRKDILQFIDLTTLSVDDNYEVIYKLCNKAKENNVAAVCTYPNFVAQTKELLAGSNVKSASVAGCFPSAQSDIDIKTAEVEYAVKSGADEIDMVISVGKLLEGNTEEVLSEIKAIKRVCGSAKLKCIIETGALKTRKDIVLASELAIEGGADFIKTSTGKISPAATIEASVYILEVIKQYYSQTGIKIGFKAAGGIATYEEAKEYIKLVETILDKDWLQPNLFRIGASRLVDDLKI